MLTHNLVETQVVCVREGGVGGPRISPQEIYEQILGRGCLSVTQYFGVYHNILINWGKQNIPEISKFACAASNRGF